MIDSITGHGTPEAAWVSNANPEWAANHGLTAFVFDTAGAVMVAFASSFKALRAVFAAFELLKDATFWRKWPVQAARAIRTISIQRAAATSSSIDGYDRWRAGAESIRRGCRNRPGVPSGSSSGNRP